MARNAEKAQSMLYRFREAKAAELAGDKGRRGGSSTSIASLDSLPRAEKMRGELVADITAKIRRMHDPTLTDAQLREMNDHINRTMDRKYGVERRIMALGGPDLRRHNRNFLTEGKEVPGIRGYRYYGRAQLLPGIKELFQQEAPKHMPRARYELVQNVDALYYGYRDEEDGTLLEYEASVTTYEPAPLPEDGGMANVPTQAQVAAWLLERKKADLLARYT